MNNVTTTTADRLQDSPAYIIAKQLGTNRQSLGMACSRVKIFLGPCITWVGCTGKCLISKK
jgi:hypothetical protein